MTAIAFDSKQYLQLQRDKILERIQMFDGKLYLEFGGKLFDDYHAARVLPGFDLNGKVKLLLHMKEDAELIMCVSAEAIEKNKIRADMGITYDEDALRLVGLLSGLGIKINSVVITLYNDQPAAAKFHSKLENMGIRAYIHRPTKGYPTDLETIISDEGYGANPYIETTRPLVVVTAPGPGSGKLATALSQLYHENKRGVKAGYAKFETFPVWNLPLKHPVNVAYEAATADLSDVNMIDPFHLEAYGKTAVNYNRDIEIFPVLNAIFESIYGENPYKSPTDMGVNMVGYCLSDDEACCEASKQEIIRRYYAALCNLANGKGTENEVNKIALLMKQAKISTSDRKTTIAAKERKEQEGAAAAAIELEDGTIITAHTSALLGPSAALILNATKHIAGIPHEVKLIPQAMIEPIQKTKVSFLHGKNPRLHTDEVLVALSMLSLWDENCKMALEHLPQLKGCQVHSTVMLSEVDQKIFKKLGIDLTCDPVAKK